MPMFAVVMTVFFMVAAVAVDFARYVAVSEKLQTATDAAATAAALTAKRYIRLEIDRGQEYVPCPGEGGGTCCSPCGKITVTGKEDELILNNGWRRYVCGCGGGGYKILDRWAEYPDKSRTVQAAEAFFNLNKPKEMESAEGGEAQITDINIFEDRSDSRYPSVEVRAHGKVKTLWMNFMDRLYPGTNFSHLGAGRCSQSESFYKELNGKYVKTAEDT